MGTGIRQIFQEDALAWLERNKEIPGGSLVTSLPDYSEFPKLTLAEWRGWFERAAALVMQSSSPDGVAIFYQRDKKLDGEWIDKAFLIQKAAEREGYRQVWHKVVSRVANGNITFGKPGYSHLLCFTKTLKVDLALSTVDILPVAGETTWPRGMGLEVCRSVCDFLLKCTSTRTLVAPFCGEGALLAVANARGLDAIGIERSLKRAERAREISLDSLLGEP